MLEQSRESYKARESQDSSEDPDDGWLDATKAFQYEGGTKRTRQQSSESGSDDSGLVSA